MFQTITKTKSTSGKLLGVKLTQTMTAINEAWVDFNESNLDMLEKVDTLDKISSDVILLENLTKQVKKTKLQPSMCTYLGAMEGVSQLAGVDFKKVNETNRDKMTKIACEGFKQKAQDFWKKIKEWFVSVLNSIKNFFARMFSLTARQANAIKKLEEGILKDKAKIDAEAFGSVEMKCYSKEQFDKIFKALGTINSSKGLGLVKRSLSNEKIVIGADVQIGAVGYKFESDKIVSGEGKPEKSKKTMKDHGWVVDSVAQEGNQMKKLLRDILSLKENIAKLEQENKIAQKQCDTMAKLGDGDDDEKERTKQGITNSRKNMAIYIKLVSIYTSNAHALIGQWISMVSKMKVASSK